MIYHNLTLNKTKNPTKTKEYKTESKMTDLKKMTTNWSMYPVFSETLYIVEIDKANKSSGSHTSKTTFLVPALCFNIVDDMNIRCRSSFS